MSGKAKIRAEITFAPVLHIQLGWGAKGNPSNNLFYQILQMALPRQTDPWSWSMHHQR